MQLDDKLTRALLVKLAEIETTLQDGDRVLIQPRIDADGGMHVANPISILGYDHEQIDAHLRSLISRGLIETNVSRMPMIGIFFSRITPKGRRQMQAV